MRLQGLLRLTNRAAEHGSMTEQEEEKTIAPKIQDHEGIKHLHYAIAEKAQTGFQDFWSSPNL
jgi:hypothetical protein